MITILKNSSLKMIVGLSIIVIKMSKNAEDDINPEDDVNVSTTSIRYVYTDADQAYMYTFKSPARAPITVYVSMVDYLNGSILPSTIDPDCRCWYCRSQIAPYSPMGCPINYVAKTDKMDEYFTTDGLFDSMPCIRAYVQENCHNPRYKDTPMLLGMMQQRLTGQSKEIPVAPSWKLLKHNGGRMSVEDWRSQFNKSSFVITENSVRAPRMSTIAVCVERKARFNV